MTNIFSLRGSLPLFALCILAGLPSLEAQQPPIAVDNDILSQLAVQEQGRKKPMTTLVREHLLTLSGRGDWQPKEGRAWSASEVMLDIWLNPQAWAERDVILVDNRPLREAMGLDRVQKLYSFDALRQNPVLQEKLDEARQIKAADDQAALGNDLTEAISVGNRLEQFAQWATGKPMTLVPHPTSPTGTWQPIGAVVSIYPQKGRSVGSTATALLEAWQTGDSATFNQSVGILASQLADLSPQVYPDEQLLALEYFYQNFHPFAWAALAFGLALIVLAMTSGWQRDGGYVLAWLLVLAGFGLQIAGLAMRVMISGRPPVTNMYETVIWVSFGVILFAMILEAVYRSRYFLLAACPAAVVTLILADAQPTVLDPSIHPLVPVLRHNTWLIIHVITIVSSYAAFLLALALAHIAIVKLWFGAKGKEMAPVYQYVYRALQIGVLLLAIGTILGGVWANYSWGRFWDWDPKECWALITLLCYLAVLHGRIGGWWGGFGVCIGAILCFQAVLMAWYGVNYVLGKGLHSYGFGTGGYEVAGAFVAAELLFVGVAIWLRQRGGGKGNPKPSTGAKAEASEKAAL